MMAIPEYWRSPDNRTYRVRRTQQQLFQPSGVRYSVRLERLGDPEGSPAGEGSVVLLEPDLLQMVRLRHQTPTPEQLYQQAFDQAVGSTPRSGSGSTGG